MAKWGPNSANSSWAAVEGWTLWQDFTAERLYSIFSDVVDSEWNIRSELHAAPTDWDGQVFDEDGLEHSVLSTHLLPPVNAALRHGLRYAKLDKLASINLGRAGRTYYEPGGDRRFKPDWALCSSNHIETFADNSFRYYSLMPGDSKLSNKWHSSFCREAATFTYWRDPVRQVLTFCIQSSSRYGFIITDKELVAIRIRTEPTGSGLGPSRSSRQQPQHSYHTSTSTDMSMLSTSMRDVSISDSSWKSTSPAVDGYPVEYRAVPWENHGRGKRQLTVRLALFYLSWMAALGRNEPQASYPSLDSSWFSIDGASVHKTTGLVSKKSVKKVEYPDPDPSGERGPRWETIEGDDDGESMQVLTLESVLTLDVTEHGGRSYYYFMDGEEEPVLVTSGIPIYDSIGQQYGYFDGLAWRVGSPPQPSENTTKRKKKHRK